MAAALLLAAAGGYLATTGALAAGTIPPDALRVSWQSTRAGGLPLTGLTVQSPASVYVSYPGTATKVDFWLDQPTTATPTHSEARAPFDLAGTASNGTARGLDLSTLSVGTHQIVARVWSNTVWRDVTATFTVVRGGAPSPSPSTPTSSTPTPAKPTPSPSVVLTSGSLIPLGWPNAATTGPRDGVVLRPSGSLTITTPGAVVSGLDISGCVTVAADNVTISNTRIRCARGEVPAVQIARGATGLTVVDTEIDGLDQTDHAVGYSGYSLLRVDIHDVYDGVRLGSDTRIENSYIHDLFRAPGVHDDATQTTGAANIVVRGNTLLPYNPRTNDPMNAAFMLGTETSKRLVNVLFENNFCDGGNYTINIRTDVVGVSNVVFRGNVFGRHHRYGVYLAPSNPQISFDASNSYVDGLPVR